jgi:hypothetical protein
MARLPGGQHLVQQVGGDVIVFEEGTEREIVRVPLLVPGDDGRLMVNRDGMARSQRVIISSDLSAEDKAFAHFWCGYFYAHATAR